MASADEDPMSPKFFPTGMTRKDKAVLLEVLRSGLEEGPMRNPNHPYNRFRIPPGRAIFAPMEERSFWTCLKDFFHNLVWYILTAASETLRTWQNDYYRARSRNYNGYYKSIQT
ncbi:uncharacterized protein LOC119672800 [Teleopsis dalmanni]|uniref:uncharacterized protein LOC119672770 n=1 Tax=Teleopsis dalmanni TaxID=139649 RepID=UPI0018CD6FA2|nr:uncharacterized protein LOC119672770 [Teleopsis dalmanni]XP_037939868.1 uncharacterized protein LOC119672800 [Teleopsis dalmanni]